MSESELYGLIMVEATRLGHRLLRNNVGKARYKSERGDVYTVPYGVGGKGGSDLIGWTMRSTVYSFQMANARVESAKFVLEAVFTAIEVKQKDKKATKEQAQFLEAVRAAGGIAGVVEDIAGYHKLIGHTE